MASSSGSSQEEWGSCEIEEEVSEKELVKRGGHYELGSITEEGSWSLDLEERENVVYVAVMEEALSMDALLWTLNNAVQDPSSALVFLVHVFPETKFIPSPRKSSISLSPFLSLSLSLSHELLAVGKLPINQVNPEQRDKFLAKESGKRRDLLQKFVNVCSASQVKVETVLIESDMEGKAILDLIPILNITKLILGATKATVRRMRSKKGNGAADLIVHKAPEFCEVKIICEGKEISELSAMESPSPSPSPSPRPTTHSTPNFAQNNEQTTDPSPACGCFKI